MSTGKYHQQVAALCYRVSRKGVEVLLVTSNGQGRWILPKGWPMKHKSAKKAALIEAYEEAGVFGKAGSKPVGQYVYEKHLADGQRLRCKATAYPIKVKRMIKRFPEHLSRKRIWVPQKRAARLVEEKSLKKLILGFQPGA